jgi:peptidoglycan hydrolase-like protein with peptidoglycan-binding domain
VDRNAYRRPEVETRAYVGALLVAATLLALAITPSPAAALGQGATRPATSRPTPAPGLIAPERLPGLFPGAGYEHGSGAVRNAQRLLARAGYDPGPLDGRYGPVTEAAVRHFQIDRGLLVDGIAGQQTLAALRVPGTLVMSGAGPGQGGSLAVRDLQRLLARAGYHPGPIDGIYGPLTDAAVERFQAASRLTPSAIMAGAAIAELAAQGGPQRATPALVRPTPIAVTPRQAPPTPAIHRKAPPAPAIIRHAPPAPVVQRYPRLAPVSHAQARRPPAPVGAPGGISVRRPGVNPSMPAVRVNPATPVPHIQLPSGSLPPGSIVLIGLAGLALLITGVAYARRASRARTPQPPQARPVGGASTVTNGSGPAAPVASGAEEADIAFHTGILLEEQGDLAGAEAAYGRADELGHGASASNLGVLLEDKGDLAGAEAAYSRADRRGESTGAFNLGVLLEEQHDFESAEEAYRRADERGHAAAAANLGVLLEARGDRIGAEAAYRRADERGEASGAFNLGLLLEEQGDLSGAEPAYRRADRPGHAKVAQLARSALLDLGSRAQLASVGGDGEGDGP